MPTKIVFGLGSLSKLKDEAKRLGGRKVIVVTDKVIMKIGAANKVISLLKDANFEVSVFDEVEPEPSLQSIKQAISFAKQKDYDLVVGVGGGSSLDVAKLVSVCLTNQGSVEEFVGSDKIPKEGKPKILIPTTAGTGSEVTHTAVITLPDKGKRSIYSNHLIADVAIVDPTLTLTMPPNITASTGLDALGHAIEGYLFPKATWFTDAIGFEATKLIIQNLPIAYSFGYDINARKAMHLSATMGGMCLRLVAGNLGVHGFGYALVSKYRLAHGVSVAVALPYLIDHHLIGIEKKLIKVAEVFGYNVNKMTDREASISAVLSIKRLIEDLGMPSSLKHLGAKEDDIDELAKVAVYDYGYMIERAARKIDEKDAKKIFKNMYEGKLSFIT
jgi:alcohol dehydrogenase class IV